MLDGGLESGLVVPEQLDTCQVGPRGDEPAVSCDGRLELFNRLIVTFSICQPQRQIDPGLRQPGSQTHRPSCRIERLVVFRLDLQFNRQVDPGVGEFVIDGNRLAVPTLGELVTARRTQLVAQAGQRQR